MGLSGWLRRMRGPRAGDVARQPEGPGAVEGSPAPGRNSPGADRGTAHPQPVIEVFDSLGRKVTISRDNWRRSVLPAELERHRDDPDGLYSVLVMALGDGFAEDLDAASRRLLEIDRDRERSHAVRGIVLLETGRLDEAEEVLRAYLETSGPSGAVLTNLAKVQDRRGDADASERILRQALDADPNLQNAVEWWFALAFEREGRPGVVRAAEELAALPGSWRAKLYLAREDLEAGKPASALARYREVLRQGSDRADALLMISADLGNAGHLAEAVSLVLPIYDAASHDPLVGFNLLQALQELGDPRRGLPLVEALAKLKLPPEMRDRLSELQAAFETMDD